MKSISKHKFQVIIVLHTKPNFKKLTCCTMFCVVKQVKQKHSKTKIQNAKGKSMQYFTDFSTKTIINTNLKA